MLLNALLFNRNIFLARFTEDDSAGTRVEGAAGILALLRGVAEPEAWGG